MRRLMPLMTLNAVMLVILSLMVLAISIPGCEPTGVQQKPAQSVHEKKADIEIEHGDGRTKIDVDRRRDGGLKIDIKKEDNGQKNSKDDSTEKTQTEPRRRAAPLRISSLA